MSEWQLKEAKARLGELIKRAKTHGPQCIAVRGRPAAVILSEEHYQRLTRPRLRFVDFMRSSPLAGVELDVRRDRSSVRKARLR